MIGSGQKQGVFLQIQNRDHLSRISGLILLFLILFWLEQDPHQLSFYPHLIAFGYPSDIFYHLADQRFAFSIFQLWFLYLPPKLVSGQIGIGHQLILAVIPTAHSEHHPNI